MQDAGVLSIAEDFRRARRKARLQRVTAQLTGHPDQLLVYDEVRRQLHGVENAAVTRQEVPLEAIVGSVGRYGDFNRAFSPLKDSDLDRWVKVKQAFVGPSGVPPIEVYRLGDVYFVKDGNHRVSVARQLGAKTIDAYVTVVRTAVPLHPQVTPDDLIIKAEYADFLARTRLRELRPEADLEVSVPGQYERLSEHISVHRYFMGLDERREVSFDEAVAHWYDAFYRPITALIQEHALAHPPGRTPTDLYLWFADYRANLERDLGWSLPPGAVLHDFSAQTEGQPRSVAADKARPLLQSLLVALNGTEAGWAALQQALHVAGREQLRLYGLHVSTPPSQSPDAQGLRREFLRRCHEAGVAGEFAVAAGGVVATLSERARWADLVVAPLTYPPGQAHVKRYGGFHTLLRRCPRPVLAVPGRPSRLARPLLGYNGTPKADVALLMAAYLAVREQVQLKVVTVSEGGRAEHAVLERARSYLGGCGVKADYEMAEGPVVPALLASIRKHQADLLIVGSYEYPTLLEPIFGGVLDDLLRQSRAPLLICQ